MHALQRSAYLALPACRWHGLADRARLHTQSVGVGEGRYLTIGTAPLEEGGRGGGGDAAAGRVRLTSEQAALARFIYDSAMMVRLHAAAAADLSAADPSGLPSAAPHAPLSQLHH